jgi:glycosyltransferase involved in cell wall biosynthesis
MMAGGAELHLLALCRQLAMRGVRQTVVYLHDRPVTRNLRTEFEDAGIATYQIPANGRYNVTFPFAVASAVGALRPDLLHTHLPRADLAGGFVKFRRPDLPWVVSMHNIYTARSWSGPGLLPVLDFVWRRADAVIAISHAVADWLTRVRRIHADRVRVIHYGIDPAPFLVAHSDARARWGLPGGPVVAAIGRLTPHKGFATLIRAWRTVRAQMPDAVLAIAGWDVGGYRQELESLVASLNLGSAVRFVGFVDDVPRFLSACDVFAMPSTSEGFGQVVIEAMAAARPVVVSRIEPLTEIATDGETGLLVPPGDPSVLAGALLWLLEAPDRAADIGARGRAYVLVEFSAARMADHTLAIYHRLLSGRGHVTHEAVDA